MLIEGGPTLAVLIDGDNVTSKIINELVAEIAKIGTASVKRIYADWTKPNLSGWKSCLLEHSFQPMQQFAHTTGKNSTDGAMIIDAMDLLYTGRFAGFCLVSSDSDFARLAARLREQGATVYGFGERKTPRAFITACDRFVYFDVLGALKPTSGAEDGQITPAARLAPEMLEMLTAAVVASSDEDGRANLARVGAYLAKQAPDFDPRNFGFARLSELVAASGIVELDRSRHQNVVSVKLSNSKLPSTTRR